MQTYYFHRAFAWLKLALWISAFVAGVAFTAITLNE